MDNQPYNTPVRIYQDGNLVMLAAPMPGLEPQNISVTIAGNRITIRGEERGPGQHRKDLLLAEWTIGPYYREVVLPEPVDGVLANATYGNGILALSMPKLPLGKAANGSIEFQLEILEAVRGERVGHTGRAIHPTTTEEHCRQIHRPIYKT